MMCLSLPTVFILGATVHACRKAGRHFLAMEEDEDIFNCVLQPLIKVLDVDANKKPRVDDVVSLGDPNEEVEPSAPTIVRLNRYCT